MGDEKVTRRLETLIARPGGCLNLTSNSLDTPVEVMTTSTNGLSGSNANVFVAPAMSKCCRYEREPTV